MKELLKSANNYKSYERMNDGTHSFPDALYT